MGITAEKIRPRYSENSLLGLRSENNLKLARQVETGLAYSSLERLSKISGLSVESLRVAVRMSRRTITRRRIEKRLSPDESDRLVSVSRLLAQAFDLFEGNIPSAVRWFTSPNKALGKITPLEAAATEVGSREVENLIGRLEHGVFT
ncbi:MAG: type II RES/Xre toxin-antitoxin system antitoxin [Pyrinomonadaceae bacterium]